MIGNQSRKDKKSQRKMENNEEGQEKSKKIGNWGKKKSKESKEDEKRKIETSIGKGEWGRFKLRYWARGLYGLKTVCKNEHELNKLNHF